ncbi:MAG TPA: 16S rRNA (cytidine(1402)-2'-O)-methyltransferase [Fimbriimonadaceae bacterium]|nr:16S rRNA (cytidine(1402)-2'-O)-methyltransferase [Fimbriimonadaceae bacterium]
MLRVVATPIGNLGDLSSRAVAALTDVDFWIVEDARVSGKLQILLGLQRPMRVLNDHTPDAKVEGYVAELTSGRRAALLTDAGTPAISDPGARLVDRCREEGVEIEGIPGPSAPALALSISGFFAQRYAFLGYLPRKPGALRNELEPFADSPLTLVLFESPHRIDKTLAVAAEVLGSRRYAICRELTKMHEQVFRATLPTLPDPASVPRKGEITIVIEGQRRRERHERDDEDG